jgi:hypothetical protein
VAPRRGAWTCPIPAPPGAGLAATAQAVYEVATAPITVRGVLTCPTTSLAALAAQTVTVPGSNATEIVLPKRADSPKAILQQRKNIAEDVERMLDDHPLSPVLMSMPGTGVRTAARILLEVGDGSAFTSAAHPAAYAGIAPVTHRSGSSIRGEHPARSGNRKLERALFLSAFAALHDPTSRAYYDRKHAEGKKHNVALIYLARRRCDVLYAMLKNKTFYRVRDSVSRRTSGCAADPPRCGSYLPDLLDRVWNGRIEPGKVFDLTLRLAQVAEAYAAMDERRATKVLLRP